MFKFLTYILMLVTMLSCGQRSQEELREAIDVAQTLLTEEKCEEAIELLEDVGRQPKDALYVQVLASAYACRAGFRAVPFISNDLPRINSVSLLSSISILTYSLQTAADSAAYLDIKRALSILQQTDKQLSRNTLFGARKAGDIGVQILVLSLVQLGKFSHFYGNVDGTGTKGAGAGVNGCYLNYADLTALAIVGAGTTGSCTGGSDGHPDLAGAALIRRVCEGSTLIANILDVIKNIDLSASSSFSSLETITATVDAYRADAQAQGVDHLIDLTSQAECEALLTNPTELNNMQIYYAAVFENNHL